MTTDTPRPYGCKCQTLRERALGDGCDECNKALVIEMLTDERDELQASVERLMVQLSRAIEIYDVLFPHISSATHYGEKREIREKINVLKEEIA